jgi:NAD-dependent dihydropyrimidine dehydrogenase PreA subunit
MDCVEVCPVDCFYEGENLLVIHPEAEQAGAQLAAPIGGAVRLTRTRTLTSQSKRSL